LGRNLQQVEIWAKGLGIGGQERERRRLGEERDRGEGGKLRGDGLWRRDNIGRPDLKGKRKQEGKDEDIFWNRKIDGVTKIERTA